MWGLHGFFFAITCIGFVTAGTAQAQAPCPPDAGGECAGGEGPATEEEEAAGEGERYLPWRLQMEDERPPDLDQPASGPRWYGWQTLMVDGISIAWVGASGVLELPALTVASIGMWLLGSPIVHLVNGNGGGAAMSFAIRLGSGLAAVLGLALALANALDESEDRSEGAVTAGLAISLTGAAGMLAAMALDPSLFAFTKARPSADRGMRVLPWIDPQRGRAGLRIGIAL